MGLLIRGTRVLFVLLLLSSLSISADRFAYQDEEKPAPAGPYDKLVEESKIRVDYAGVSKIRTAYRKDYLLVSCGGIRLVNLEKSKAQQLFVNKAYLPWEGDNIVVLPGTGKVELRPLTSVAKAGKALSDFKAAEVAVSPRGKWAVGWRTDGANLDQPHTKLVIWSGKNLESATQELLADVGGKIVAWWFAKDVLVTASEGKMLHTWDLKAGTLGGEVKLRKFQVRELRKNHDGSTVAISTMKGKLVILEGHQLSIQKEIDLPLGFGAKWELSPFGGYLVAQEAKGGLPSRTRLLVLPDANEIVSWDAGKKGENGFLDFAFSPNGKHLLRVERKGGFDIVATEDGKRVARYTLPSGKATSASFSADGKRVYIGDNQGVLHIFAPKKSK